MKKNLLFLFALVCVTSFFSSCGDDEDNGWKDIPSSIPSSNVTMSLNSGTISGATASLQVESGDAGVLTLNNLLYKHASVPVNVTLTKISEGSYDFEGSANIDGTTKADDLGLTINVKGNVTTAGKLTVNVTTSGWGSISNVFSGDSLNVTYDGTANHSFPVTLLTTAKGKASLLFSKIPNVAANATTEVTITENGDSYKLEGTNTLDGGFTVKISGTATKTLLTLAVTTSGYGTISKSYTPSESTITYDGTALTSGSVTLKATSETAGAISITGVIPGPSDSSVEIPNCTLKEASDGSYTVSGSSKTSAYEVSFSGTIANKKMNGAITYKILSSIVGTWKPKIGTSGAESIFNFTSKTGYVTFSDGVISMLPAELKPYILKTMPDAAFKQVIQTLLAQYAQYLTSIQFAEGGDVNFTFMKLNSTTPTTINGLLKYYIQNNQVYLVIDLAKAITLIPQTKTWDSSTIFTDGVPLTFAISNGTLNIVLTQEVATGIVGLVNQMLPLIGSMMDSSQAAMLTTIFGNVNSIMGECTSFEAGLVLAK